MPNTDGRVYIQIEGDDSKLKQALNSSESSLKSFKSLAVKLGLGALFAKEVKQAVSATNEFESSIAKASTLFGGVSVDVDSLNRKILELSKTTGMEASAIGNSLYNALSAGIEVSEDMGDSMQFLESCTRLAKAGFTDVDTAVTATAKVLNAYGMSVDQTDKIHRILMQTQNKGITTVDQLGSSLAQVTPTAAQFGVSFEDVGAALAIMTKQGIKADMATTQLRAMLAELGKSGTKASETLRNLTGKAFTELMDEGKSLGDILDVLQKEADSTGVKILDMFSSIEAGNAGSALSDLEAYDEMLKAMNTDIDLVGDAYDKLMATRTEKWNRFKNDLNNISIKIINADAAKDTLDDLTDIAQGMLDRIDAWLPDALADLNAFYLQSKLIFSYLQGEYDRSFLKKGVDFVIKVVRDELDSLKKSFESGDVFGAALKLVGDLITIKVGFSLLQSLGSLVLSSFTGSFLTRNGALMLVGDALMVYFGFKQAQKDGDWETFGASLVAAILAGTITAGLTGSLSGGLLVFGIAFKLTNSITNALKDRNKPAPEVAKEEAAADPTAKPSKKLLNKIMVDDDTREAIAEMEVSSVADDMDRIADILKRKVSDNIEEMDAQIISKIKEIWSTELGRKTIIDLTGGLEIGMTDEEMENIGINSALMLLGGVRNTLGIYSPSKEFEKIGEYCVQGLANGMTKSDAKNQLDTAFDTIYENMRQAVKEGSMTLEESFRELQTMLSLADAYTGRIGSFVSEPSKVRTTGGGGRNSMEGFSLDKDGRWVEAVKAPEPSGWDNFWKAMALGADTGIERLFDLFEGMTVVEDGVERLTEKGQFWADTMNGAVTTMLSSFETLGQDLVEGELSWRSFANVGLEALASLLEALGYQLASMAISTYPNFAQMALSAAGSAAAFAFAGMVRGSKFESGGIVGGSGITGDRHMIFANAGELILNRTQQNALAGQLSAGRSMSVNIEFSGNVFGDERSISEYVYNGIRTAQHEGVIGEW